jgi:hypothetical protein
MCHSQCHHHPPAWLATYHTYPSALDTSVEGLVTKLLAKQRHMATEVEEHTFAITRNLSVQILDAIKPTFSATPIDLHVACPQSFYNLLTWGWTAYHPRHICAGYLLYFLCTNIALFYTHFPNEHFSRTFPYAGTPLDYSIITSPDHPICTIYSPALCNLALHFTYHLHPLPAAFIPHYCSGSMYCQHLYYQACQARTHHTATSLLPAPRSPLHSE